MCVIFKLGRQGIPLHGDWKEITGSEFNSNFHQLNLLWSEDNSKFESWEKMENDISRNPK